MKMRSVTTLLLAALYACSLIALAQQNVSTDFGGTSWQLVKFQSMDDTSLVPGGSSRYTLAFEAGGGLSVQVDCNRGRGTWRSAGPSQIEFGPVALTRMMCPPSPLTDRFARDLDHMRSYVIRDGHLFLALKMDSGIYEFAPLETAGKQAPITELPATFLGVLPCADCAAIFYQINLLPDRTFTSRSAYLKQGLNVMGPVHGNWQLSGMILTLTGERGEREQFAVHDAGTLRKLDNEGHEITSRFSYDLRRIETFAPIEPQNQSSADAALEGTNWSLIRVGATKIAPEGPQHVLPSLVFDSQEKRVSGFGGCNRITGGYKLDGDKLTFTGMAMTMMACIHSMETESKFVDALNKVQRWKIRGQQMELYDASGSVLAVFKADNDAKAP